MPAVNFLLGMVGGFLAIHFGGWPGWGWFMGGLVLGAVIGAINEVSSGR